MENFDVEALARKTKFAAKEVALAGAERKNALLRAISKEIQERSEEILKANENDLVSARKNGMDDAMQDRLMLSKERIASMCAAVNELAAAEDPVGKVLCGSVRPNGLKIEQVTVPMGVIAVIFESRPNVTVDSATLALKAGSGVILRGGKEAFQTNLALSNCMKSAAEKAGFNPDIIGFIESTNRQSAMELMRLNGLVDLLIPRGGAGLISSCVQNATIPVIETGTGNCHIYVDEFADLSMAQSIIENAKLSRPSVCNAAESIVVHKAVVKKLADALNQSGFCKKVQVHADEESLPFFENAVLADDDDFSREYLSLDISVKTVENLENAISHIMQTTTGHSECIVTESFSNAQRFLDEVDAAAVYVNASTRFTDGGEFGFGAEIGISTQKLHARGPLGLSHIVSTKYKITGNGQVR